MVQFLQEFEVELARGQVGVTAAQAASHQPHGQFPRVKHQPDASAGRQLRQHLQPGHVYRIE